MSLTELASLGNFISSIAVVVTLVLVLIQLRQTNNNQKALMQQGRSARTVNAMLASIEPSIAEAMSRAIAGDTTLTATQVFAVNVNAQAMFWNVEDSFLQHRAALLDDLSWETDLETLRLALSTPAFRVAWKLSRRKASRAYRAFVDDLVETIKPAQPFDELTTWKTLMAKELAAAPH